MKTKHTLIGIGLATLLLATPILANNMNTGGQEGISRTTSTYPLGAGSIYGGLNAKFDYAKNGAYFYNVDGQFKKESPTLLSQDLFLGYGLTNWADLSMDLAVYQDLLDNYTKKTTGMGDLSVALKLQHPGLYEHAPLRVAYLGRFSFPTGTQGRGYFHRHSYYGREGDQRNSVDAFTANGIRFQPQMVWTLDFAKFPKRTPVAIHGNIGPNIHLFSSDTTVVGSQPAVVGALAVEYRPATGFGYFTELSGELHFINFERGFNPFTELNKDVLVWTLGTTYRAKNGLQTGLGVDIGLNDRTKRTFYTRRDDDDRLLTYSTPSNPRIGVNLSIAYRKPGKNAKHFMGRFFAPEDTVLVTKYDTLKVVQNDTLLVIERDTVKVVETTPAQTIIDRGIMVFRSINFMTGSAQLTEGSYPALDDIASSLVKFQEVRIEVRGYTDNTGSADVNQRLSQARAESVVSYLTGKGVAASRLTAVGKGPANPIADNATLEGRVLNRRVEIKRID